MNETPSTRRLSGEEKAVARHRDTMNMRHEVQKYDPDALSRFDAVFGAMVVLMQFFLAIIVNQAALSYRMNRHEKRLAGAAVSPSEKHP
jgi:hypothetical protein